ncbi:hypothetical protein ACV3PA_14270 [Exiguobacterium acetylicum]|uniref:hypothetical protein n=1 Tax=Exiguobacterium sp. BMC-KP TaxID=1684312 RepID=UPI0006AA58D9|nr:hypothetical protein [Exiguobacterium sp. BMC-KP]KOP28585.1 hypothetical protein ADM98_06450 [Exiguobacterium sp. BMC-KP]
MCHILVVDETSFAIRQAVVHYYETKEPFYLPGELAEGEEVFLATNDGIIAYAEALFTEYTTRPEDPFWLTAADDSEGSYVCLDLISVDLRHPLLGRPLNQLNLKSGSVEGVFRTRLLDSWQYGYFETDVLTLEQAKQRRNERFKERNHLEQVADQCIHCEETRQSLLEWHLTPEGYQTVCPTCHRWLHQQMLHAVDTAAATEENE